MFTVIICNQDIIDDCKGKYKSFLKNFMDDGVSSANYEFVAWNTKADTIADAVPELERVVELHNEWRAFVICDESVLGYKGIDKKNPFDLCNYVKPSESFLNKDKDGQYTVSVDDINHFRKKKKETFENAIKHPLIKLTNWLNGANIIDYEDPRENWVEDSEVMTEELLNTILIEKAHLGKREAVLESELNRARIIRDNMLEHKFTEYSEIDKSPKQIVILAERAIVKHEYTLDISKEYLETEYSEFYEDNMYPSNVRFVLYNNHYVSKGKRDPADYFGMIVFINVFAKFTYPNDAIRPNRVYSAHTEMSFENLRKICDSYIAKLKVTSRYIDRLSKNIQDTRRQVLDDKIAREEFEPKESIDVYIDASFDTDDMKCTSKGISFVGDKPVDEKEFWDDQIDEIEKTFTRYIREPRRAIKKAVVDRLARNKTVVDERILNMNDIQKENTYFNLLDEEEEMVNVDIVDTFDVDEYKKSIKKGRNAVEKRLGQRMTLKKTIISVLLFVLFVFMSFIPLLLDSLIGFAGESMAVLMMAVSCGIALIVALVMVWYFRVEVIRVFAKFNEIIDSIIEDVESSLNTFASYFSHAASVMKSFYILDYLDDNHNRELKVYNKHLKNIDAQIMNVRSLFPNYVSELDDIKIDGNVFPYSENDYASEKDYQFELPVADNMAKIKFLQTGNEIMVPDYIKEITLKREEFYD